MPPAAYTAHVAPTIGPLLVAGEALVAAAPMVLDPGTTEDVSVADELRYLLDPTILLGAGGHPGALLQRAAFGRAALGAPGSAGRRLHEQLTGLVTPVLAVTDRRLLVVALDSEPEHARPWWRRWFGPVRRTARLVHGLPLAAVSSAVRAPAGVLRRGRLLVGFPDGSACALVCTPPSLAGPVLAAIAPSSGAR